MAMPVNSVLDESDMLALSASQGDWCYRLDLSQTWRLVGTDPTVLADWEAKGMPKGTSIYLDSVTGTRMIARKGEAETFLNEPDSSTVITVLENRTDDPASPATGRMWLRTDL